MCMPLKLHYAERFYRFGIAALQTSVHQIVLGIYENVKFYHYPNESLCEILDTTGIFGQYLILFYFI